MTRAVNAHGQQQQQATPLAKLLDKKQSRGGGLRVGRVVSEVRNGREDANPNQASASRCLQDDERRIQENMIEMLTVKLAKRERENELLKIQQRSLDETRASYESHVQQLQAESSTMKAELMDANEQLQRQLQLLQCQFDRIKEEGEARNAAAQELKRLREKDQVAFRALDAERQSVIEQLKRDVRTCNADRNIMEAKLVAALNQQQDLSAQAIHLEAKNQRLEGSLQVEHELRRQAEQKLGESTLSLEQEQRERANLKDQLQRLVQEKQLLEEKHRLLSKSIKDASAKAVDADKKRLELTRNEDQLGAQLAQLKKENEELKARRTQTSAQAKHLNTKIAVLEKTCESSQLKLNDALDEVDGARKCSREYQFRIKQLQEELLFLEKRKKTETAAQVGTVAPQGIPVAPVAAGAEKPAEVVKSPESSDIPSWMQG